MDQAVQALIDSAVKDSLEDALAPLHTKVAAHETKFLAQEKDCKTLRDKVQVLEGKLKELTPTASEPVHRWSRRWRMFRA